MIPSQSASNSSSANNSSLQSFGLQSKASRADTSHAEPASDRTNWLLSIPFLMVHIAGIATPFLFGWSWKWAAIGLASYFLRMFWVTAGYHRYFSHCSFKTSRFVQFIFAFMAMTSTQKGVLWWAAHHRHHHQYSDQDEDIHSFHRRGFLYSHVKWVLSDRWAEIEWSRIPDLAKYPELRFLDRFHVLPTILFASTCYFLGGLKGLFWAYFFGTTLLWHGTFAINSLAHWMGKRRYKTSDESRNSWFLAILTLGEGWHNNHHFYSHSTRQGFFWWEYDVTYYILKLMSFLGLIWDLKNPPPHVYKRAKTDYAAP